MLHAKIIRKVRPWRVALLATFVLTGLCLLTGPVLGQPQKRLRTGMKVIQLPDPNTLGRIGLEEAISKRRSVKQFVPEMLNFAQIGQLAWAGQGITDKQMGLRAAPSVGDLYPIELYFFTPEGLFFYRPENHSLQQVSSSDQREELLKAVQRQAPVTEAACDIVIAGSVRKLAAAYGNKAMKFMLLEAGHVAENIQLQAVALGLASVTVESFDIKNVAKACEMPGEMEPLLIICVGHPLVPQAESQSAGKTAYGAKKAVLVVPEVDFRDEEFFETQRILNGSGINTVVAGPRIGSLRGISGGIIPCEVALDNMRVEDFDAVVFIGGPGAEAYYANQTALGVAREAAARHKVIAAIDTAPAILANAGVLRGVRATGFLSLREVMQQGGSHYTGAPVERDGLVITASGPLAVIPFAQSIAGALQQEQPKTEKKP
jgi:SagB-type dehydrogenase family enzyme